MTKWAVRECLVQMMLTLRMSRLRWETGSQWSETAEQTLSSQVRRTLITLGHTVQCCYVAEPGMFTCSSCKKSLDSAWSLIQHVEKLHGIQCCLENDRAKAGASQSEASITPHDLLLTNQKTVPSRPPPEYRPPVSRPSMPASAPTYFPPHLPPSLYPLLPGPLLSLTINKQRF